MNTKGAMQATIELAQQRGMDDGLNKIPGMGYKHLYSMWTKVCFNDFSEAKLNRWLGWMQCAIVADGYATLEEMKELNRRYTDPTAEPV